MMAEPLREEQRQDVFRLLVELQDAGCSVEDSRIRIANQFGVEVPDIEQVEREGIARQWPPL